MTTFAFVTQRGSLNPLNVVDVDNNSVPAFIDVDGDGDLDAAIGNRAGAVAFYRNNEGNFVQQSGTANPFSAVNVDPNPSDNSGGYSVPTFVDLDGDGDLDAPIGNIAGSIFYFRNENGQFVQQRGTLNPFLGIDIGSYSFPAFVDIDGDGDRDLAIGNEEGSIFYFRNESGRFVQQRGTLNPFLGIDVGSLSAPAFGDVDRDGNVDIVIGNQDGTFYYFRNENGRFVQQRGTLNPFLGIDVGAVSAPAFADLDEDGDQDVFTGSRGFGDVILLRKNVPLYVGRTGTANPFNRVVVETSPVPTFADLDGDGDLDAFLGEVYGGIQYYRNDSGVFRQITGSANPVNNVNVGLFSTPTFVDIDNDGDLDLFSGEFAGTINFFRNNNGQFVAQGGSANPFSGIDVGEYSNIAFADVDGDGDEDAFLGLFDGTVDYLRNENGAFVRRPGLNPLRGADAGYFSFPSFADVEGDGDVDALVGDLLGRVQFFRNDNRGDGALTAVTGSSNPFNGIDIGFYAAPALADVDGDGDVDTVIGGDFALQAPNRPNRGRLSFFENVDGDPGVSGPRTVAASLLASTEDELLSGGQSLSAAAPPDIAVSVPLAATTANADAQRDDLAEVQALMAADSQIVI